MTFVILMEPPFDGTWCVLRACRRSERLLKLPRTVLENAAVSVEVFGTQNVFASAMKNMHKDLFVPLPLPPLHKKCTHCLIGGKKPAQMQLGSGAADEGCHPPYQPFPKAHASTHRPLAGPRKRWMSR